MGLFGFMSLVMKGIIYLAALVIPTIFLTLLACLPLTMAEFIPSIFRIVAALISTGAFGIGVGTIIFAQRWTVIRYSGPVGFIVPWVVTLIGLFVNISLSLGTPVVLVIIGFLGLSLYRFRERIPLHLGLGLLSNRTDMLIGAIELVEVPSSFTEQEDDMLSHRRQYNTALSIIRSMRSSDYSIGLRLEVIDSRHRLFFLTHADDEDDLQDALAVLDSTLRANLTGFSFATHRHFKGHEISDRTIGMMGYVTGEPLSMEDLSQRADSLDLITEVLHSVSDAVVQVILTPTSSGWLHRRLLKSNLGKERERAIVQVSSPKKRLFGNDGSQTVSQIDLGATEKVQRDGRKLRRTEASDAVKAHITISVWGRRESEVRQQVRRLSNVLSSAILPADTQHGLSIQLDSDRSTLERHLHGLPAGDGTMLVPEEAAVYLCLPRRESGIPVVERGSFRRDVLVPNAINGSHQSEAEIFLGHSVNHAGEPELRFTITPESLTKHVYIYGESGTGKTMTTIRILTELARLKIPFMVLLPSKNEDYRRLIRAVPDIRVFTPGDETIAPMPWNAHEFPKGVLVNTIFNMIMEAYVAALPSREIVRTYLEDAFKHTFTRLGWKRHKNIRGLPILLRDLPQSIPLVQEKELNYSDRGNEDFRGILHGRFRELNTGALSRVMNTVNGLTIEELVSKPTLIMLDGLSADEKALFTFLMITNVSQYFEVLKKQPGQYEHKLRFLFVLEEAHHFLQSSKTDETEGHGARNRAIESIAQLMAEGRSSGIGNVIVTPRSLGLQAGVSELAQTIIMHKRGSREDREHLGGQMNCTDEQIQEMGSLPVGHAVIRTPEALHPIRVSVRHPARDNALLDTTKAVTDDDIRQHMAEYYRSELDLAKVQYVPEMDKECLIPGVHITLDLDTIERLMEVVESEAFHDFWSACLKAAQQGAPTKGAMFLLCVVDIAVSTWRDYEYLSRYLLWHVDDVETDAKKRALIRDFAEIVSVLLELPVSPWTEDDSTVWHFLRMRTEVMNRLHSKKPRDWRLTVLAMAKQVVAEYKHNASQYRRKLMQSDGTSQDSTQEEYREIIRTMVEHHQFAAIYYDYLRQAAHGDFGPYIFLMNSSVEKVYGGKPVTSDVLKSLARTAQEVLDAPQDAFLMEQLLEKLHGSPSEGEGGFSASAET
jgi:hypothetical protein